MDRNSIRTILEEVRQGNLPVEDALNSLRDLPYQDVGFARIDNHRTLRTGHPEVVFCPGKTPGQVASIMTRLARKNSLVMATRADEETFRQVAEVLPGAWYHPEARMILSSPIPNPVSKGCIAILTGGTSDIPVAREAEITARAMGSPVETFFDVGVAGIHRLFGIRDRLMGASVVVVAAGMEGALASIVGGLVASPVIAVPTSIGYGASFHGLSALLTMLNSCAPGVAVVNIDNGFGAGYMAAIINSMGDHL